MSVWLAEKHPAERRLKFMLASLVATVGLLLLLIVDIGLGGVLFLESNGETQLLAGFALLVQIGIIVVLAVLVMLENEPR